MTNSSSLAATCAATYKEYQQCLYKSNRDPSKCSSYHSKLHACEKGLGTHYCVEEASALLKCSKSPDPSVCSKEFIAMRECHRPDGAHLSVVNDSEGKPRYEIRSDVAHRYAVASPDVSSAESPTRCASRLDDMVGTLKNTLGTNSFDAVPYTWESLRGQPGK